MDDDVPYSPDLAYVHQQGYGYHGEATAPGVLALLDGVREASWPWWHQELTSEGARSAWSALRRSASICESTSALELKHQAL